MWKDWLSFSRREQYGIIALSSILFLLVILRILMAISWNLSEIKVDKDASVLIERNEKDNEGAEEVQKDKPKYAFKFFDPNKVTVTELDKMGLPYLVIINWMKYLEAGGSFYHPEDIAKIYGLDSILAQELSNYVVFSENKNSNVNRSNNHFKSASIHTSVGRLSGENHRTISERRPASDIDTFIVDLNSATAEDLKKIKGIGNVLSQRIIDFRELLGGFYDREQVKEVYGISKELYENINHHFVINTGVYRKISINRASIFYLRKHPYLNFYQARDIIEYRKKKGYITSKQQLKSIPSIDEETLKKLLPYIDFSVDKQKIED